MPEYIHSDSVDGFILEGFAQPAEVRDVSSCAKFCGSYESFERNLLFWNGASRVVAQWRFAQWHLLHDF